MSLSRPQHYRWCVLNAQARSVGGQVPSRRFPPPWSVEDTGAAVLLRRWRDEVRKGLHQEEAHELSS
jgi:hypothetical protein